LAREKIVEIPERCPVKLDPRLEIIEEYFSDVFFLFSKNIMC